MSAASEWLVNAPESLVSLMRRMTFHHHVRWDIPAYEVVEGDRSVTVDIEEAEALSSRVANDPLADICGGPEHVVAVDVDVEAWLVPSSTEGHHHLYARLPQRVDEADYFAWLDASVAIGLLEPGYVNACKERGMTSVRAPWIRKGHERDDLQVGAA